MKSPFLALAILGALPVLTCAQSAGGGLGTDVAELPAVDWTKPPAVVNGHLKLGFDLLAGYPFIALPQPKDPKAPRWTGSEQIPDIVKGWSGRKAMVTGFMLPMKMDKGLVTEFLLMKDLASCCFGGTPAMNDLVVINLKKGVPYVAEKPVVVSGTFKVGATFDPFGYMVGIYNLDADKVEESK